VKVAVCFSGQLRTGYKKCIEKMRKILPKADFYYTSWEGEPIEPFINRYYVQPKPKFNILNKTIRIYLKKYREYQEKDWKNVEGPSNYPHVEDDHLRREMKAIIRGMREKGGTSNYQQLIHAMTVRDFIDQSKYDLIIRVRYDLYVDDRLEKHIQYFCEYVLENGNPMGFYTKTEECDFDSHLRPEITIQNTPLAKSINDFMIIHRADLFDPNIVFWLFEKKKHLAAETGWYQSLCQPYGITPINVGGLVRIHKVYQKQLEQFEVHKNNHDDIRTKYSYHDPLREINVGDW
jgi:hypothetical protein